MHAHIEEFLNNLLIGKFRQVGVQELEGVPLEMLGIPLKF